MNTQTPVSYVGKHTFTAEEKEQKLQQMLTAMREKEEIEAEFKTTKSNYKSKIDAKDGEIKLTSNLLNAGWENKTYQCTLVKNFDEGKRQYFELGTNLLVGEEPLTAADYQMQLQMDEEAIKANNEAADLQIALLHSGEEAPVDEDFENIEKGATYEYTVEPDINPLEFEETPEQQPEATVVNIDKPKKEVKKKDEPITPFEDVSDDMFGEDESEEDGDDPFSFDDI